MESGLKQRLIGAAVLVALAVIFLPMLLDTPAPQRGAEDVRLDLPTPPPADFETRELPLTVPPAPATTDAGKPVVTHDVVATVDTAKDRHAPSAVHDAASTAPEAEPASDAKPVEAVTAEDKAVEPPAAEPAPAQPKPAASSPASPPPRAADRNGRFVVRVGSFGNVDNARALARKLDAAGLKTRQETIRIDGKPALRLDVGPYAGPADANAARLAAQRVEPTLKPQVIALDAATPAVEGSGYAVQVGAFSKQQDANLLRDRLRNGGFNAFIAVTDTDAGRLYRVRVGPELERSRAEALATRLKDRFRLSGMIVNHP
ncbi:MAG: SPOR domain-containing protein [Xanthomonadales bacterium]|nr:SPOR domain-containing protein [Xanthomonadales bacterium]